MSSRISRLGTPRVPLGKISSGSGSLGDIFSGIRLGDSEGSDEGEEVPGSFDRALTGTIVQGGGDPSGWGGEDDGIGPQNIVLDFQLHSPSGADETGWGGSTDPRVMIERANQLAAAALAMGSSRNLVFAKGKAE
ncbi:MAG: hypothetical protein WA715_06260 [Candidatus Acidiferrum sp.]